MYISFNPKTIQVQCVIQKYNKNTQKINIENSLILHTVHPVFSQN